MAYLIKMMGDFDVKIDKEELPKLIEGLKRGVPVVLKQGIISPNCFRGVVEDNERLEEINRINTLNAFAIREGLQKPEELQPLRNIFEDVKLLL